MKKTIQLIVLAMLCLNLGLKAQDKTSLSGKVTDRQLQPLPGVTLKIKNTSIAATTNSRGEFSISSTQQQGSLQISSMGYKTTELNFKGTTSNLNIQLLEEQNDLDEIQIIGYGQTTKRLNTGSVSSISAKQIEQQPVTNVLSALSGRMPGVFVQTTNGLPGGNINIQIRGKGSLLAGTNPLYIIDGVPYDGAAPNAFNTSQATSNIAGHISPLNNISPSDIETITVLKDADATSIYGSRGSNGVVLITTKRAKSGDSKLHVNVQTGLSTIAQKPKLLSLTDYLQMRWEAFANDNKTPSSDPTSPNYAPDLTLWSQTEGRDWVDYIYGNNANFSDVQAKLSGGAGQTTFSVNGNYRKESAILRGHNDFNRYSLFSQLQHRSTNQKLNLSLSNQLSQQSADFANAVLNIAGNIFMAPNYPLYLPDGSANWYAATNIDGELNNRSKTLTDNNISSLYLSYDILPALSFKINAGYTKTTYRQTLLFPTAGLYPGTTNYSMFASNLSESLILEPQLHYQLKFKHSSFSFLLGATYQNRNTSNQSLNVSGFRQESLLENMASAATVDSRSNPSLQYKYASVFGRATYSLMDNYVLNATLRRDASSKFGPGNRQGNFGSLGAAWIFSNNTWLQHAIPVLSYGKLRASYGSTGNDQISDYQYLSTYSSPSGANYQDIGILKPNRISNADFHWETTLKIDVGIELGFLKDRISLAADYYRNRSLDQLVQYTLPQITGFASYQANLPAVIENSGWEMSLHAKPIDKSGFSWSSNLNFTLPKNKLLSFQDFSKSTYANVYEIGYDITRIKGNRYLGIDAATGKAQYAGIDGEVAAKPYNNFTLGKATPDWYGGFGNSFRYKGIELNVFTQFVKQAGTGRLYYSPGVYVYNNFDMMKDSWKASTIADPNMRSSSFNVFDTSYLRLKTVSLAYDFSGGLLRSLKIDNLRLYLDGQNLLTLQHQNIAVLDVESGGTSTGLYKNVPPVKTFIMGLQFTLK
jgi:TonB-linked SusC/RagA family outer membrane protein